MMRRLTLLTRKYVLPTVVAGSMLLLSTPGTLMAGEHEGRYGGGGRSYSGGGRIYSGRQRYFGGHRYYGGRGYYGGRSWVGGDRYYRRGSSFGFYTAPYGYGPGYYYNPPPICSPAGYYDQWGNWRFYPGCYVNPWGY